MGFNHGLGLVHRLISRRHTAVGDFADFQGAIAGDAFGGWVTDNRCSDSKALHGLV
jgi:hypothetical protein